MITIKTKIKSPIGILIIEDNPGDILLIKEELKHIKLNSTISIAKDGEQALEMLKNQNVYINFKKPDLILSDINLPKINGHQVLEEIKNDYNLKNIPVVIITSSSLPEDKIETFKNQAHAYITKPIDEDPVLRNYDHRHNKSEKN